LGSFDCENFPLKNGYNKNDVIVSIKSDEYNVGDVIRFEPDSVSTASMTLAHRIVKINDDGTYQTKGDHNEGQLTKENNIIKTDETSINKNQIKGKVIFKTPFYIFYPILYGIEILIVLLITSFISNKDK